MAEVLSLRRLFAMPPRQVKRQAMRMILLSTAIRLFGGLRSSSRLLTYPQEGLTCGHSPKVDSSTKLCSRSEWAAINIVS